MVSHLRKIFSKSFKTDYFTHTSDDIVTIPIIAINGLHENAITIISLRHNSRQ